MKVPELIHYGNDKFEHSLFKPIENNNIKPRGGLWTSPVSSKWGWKNFCRQEGFWVETLKKSFKLKLKKDSSVFIIDSYQDLTKMIFKKHKYCNLHIIDFEKISEKYDAIWLTVKGQKETRLSEPYNLYGWDVESVLILNKESIELL